MLKRSSSSAVTTGLLNGLRACLCQLLSLVGADCGGVRRGELVGGRRENMDSSAAIEDDIMVCPDEVAVVSW